MHALNEGLCLFYSAAEESEIVPPSASPGCQADPTDTPTVSDTLEPSPDPAGLQSQVGKSHLLKSPPAPPTVPLLAFLQTGWFLGLWGP